MIAALRGAAPAASLTRGEEAGVVGLRLGFVGCLVGTVEVT